MSDQPNTHSSKQFYFINKSEKSSCLSKSLPAETAAVQRHVQTGRKRSRKPKSAQNKKDEHHTVRCRPIESASRPDSTKNCTDVMTAVSLPITSNELRPASISSHASPTYQTVLCKHDPFNATSIPINSRVAGLLHYYMYYHHPSQWPNEMAVLRQGVYIFQDAVLKVMRTAVADELTMYCLLSATSCRLQFVDRIPAALVIGTERQYIHEALRLMSTYVKSNNLNDAKQLKQFLIYIVLLGSAEAYRGDMYAAEAHLKAAAQVLGPVGGLAAVSDESLRGQLAMADLFLACVKLRPCLLDCSYDPGSVSALRLATHELRVQCTSITAQSLLCRTDGLLPSEFRALIQDLVESHSVKSRLSTSSMLPHRALLVTHWITMRNMAIRHKLLALTLPDQKTHALRVAIIMWTLLAMNITGRAKTVKIMAPMLEHLVFDIPPSAWNGHEDIKLWIMLVGLYCATERSSVSTAFMNGLRASSTLWSLLNPARTCATNLAERLKLFQRKFFFDESVQEGQGRTISESLCSGPPDLRGRELSD